MGERIRNYRELKVFQKSMDLAMEIFQITKSFPAEEKYSLADKWLIKPRT
jgi:hypothetical protein